MVTKRVYMLANNACMVIKTTCMVINNACLVVSHTCLANAEAVVCGGGRERRPTIDPIVVGRAVYESDGIDKDSMNCSTKMIAPTMGPHTEFKQGESNFLKLMSLKAACLIP
jgi:hypothetical protein